MAWTKAKTAIVVGVAAILAAGTTPIVIHHYRNASIFSRTQELSSNEDAQYAKLTGTTPEQAVKAFFEACSQEDWTEAAKFWQPSTRYPGPLGDKFQSYFRGMQVVTLGKPFWGWFSARGKYGGVWVPYEIRLKNGEVRKGQLQIRCDNPDKRWFVEGGL